MSAFELPDSKKLAEIAAAYRLQLIVLFGSAARGRMSSESDIDLGILVGKKLNLSKRTALWSEFSRLFPHEVDLTILNYLNPVFRFEIARDGIVLFEDRVDRWDNWKSYTIRQYWDTEKFRLDLSNFIARRAEEMRHALAE
jgi:predicted nucleotidyltransferase